MFIIRREKEIYLPNRNSRAVKSEAALSLPHSLSSALLQPSCLLWMTTSPTAQPQIRLSTEIEQGGGLREAAPSHMVSPRSSPALNVAAKLSPLSCGSAAADPTRSLIARPMRSFLSPADNILTGLSPPRVSLPGIPGEAMAKKQASSPQTDWSPLCHHLNTLKNKMLLTNQRKASSSAEQPETGQADHACISPNFSQQAPSLLTPWGTQGFSLSYPVPHPVLCSDPISSPLQVISFLPIE